MKRSIGKKIAGLGLALMTWFALAACSRADRSEVAMAGSKNDECQYKICQGDMLPPHDSSKEIVLKLDGRWFVGPRTYFDPGMNGASFYWPSRRSTRAEPPPQPEALQAPQSEEVIDVFLRSRLLPTKPYGYALVELAEQNQWIATRTTVRPGLERIEMKHVIGPNGHYLDNHTYYVATALTDPEGLPPVGSCNHDDPKNGGGMGFMWRDGIWGGIRMNERLCVDLPEIYQETMRVLSLLKEVK